MSVVLQHVTVLTQEAVDALNVVPDKTYVDCTYGRGGHSRAILQRLGKHGRLIALDCDLEAVQAASDVDDARFSIIHSRFGSLPEVLRRQGVHQVAGILFDLGISSPQIDSAARGFSFRFDAPLDMRMDQSEGFTVAEYLSEVTEQQLAEVIHRYGEERFAKRIARAIVAARQQVGNIVSTHQLARIIANAVPHARDSQNPATRTFQALRIFINRELEELSTSLPLCVELLAPRGRLVVISFHSLEDRMVKRFIHTQQHRDQAPARFALRADQLPPSRLVAVGRAIRPSVAEVAANPRARSAVMRVAERTVSP